jgi:hypothetical protein
MKKSNIYYFKKTFYFVFTLAFVYILVKGFFDIDYSTQSLYKLLLTSLIAGLVTGALLGLINMIWLKRENFFIANKRPLDKQ